MGMGGRAGRAGIVVGMVAGIVAGRYASPLWYS